MHVCFINQYFPPDIAATGRLLGQLTEDLSKVHRVTVICGSPTYDPDRSVLSKPTSVDIRRIPLFPSSRKNLAIRILNYCLFMAGGALRVLRIDRPDVVICWTDPPVIGLAGVLAKSVFGSKLIQVFQDVYPEVAVASGKMSGPFSRLILSRAARWILASADGIVAIGQDMKKLLMAKGAPAFRIRVIPNWQDLEILKPTDGKNFRSAQNISPDAFVVMHSGNVGVSQDLSGLLNTARELKGDPNIIFVIVGSGAGLKDLERNAGEMELSNVRFLPYQPESVLADALSAADLHYVSLLPAFTGTIVPSKIHGIFAVGRPVLANLPPNCDTAAIVRESEAGFLCSSEPKELADAIRRARGDRPKLTEMGKNALGWVEKNAGRSQATSRYGALLEEVIRT